MALTQMQLIQSLGEAMSWLERELSWGVPPTELRHLCGRIGELYTAVITNGQMATEVNQHGYDVISGKGERISVKTTARANGHSHVTLNPNTLDQVDRLIALRINTEDMQVEVEADAPIEKVKTLLNNRSQILISSLTPATKQQPRGIKVIREALVDGYSIKELETGSFEVSKSGKILTPTKTHLIPIAKRQGVEYLREDGTKFNTRQLGTRVLRSLLNED